MPRITNLNELERKGKLIKGQWKLDPRHRLFYASEETEERIRFDTSLIAAEPDALIVSLTEKQDNGKMVTRLAKFTGRWRANETQKIEFEVERESGKNDVLTFRGAWKVNDSNEISYTYRKAFLKRKTTILETLTFRGFWNISEKNRLAYTLEGASDETFRFRGAFQTPSILAKKGEIRYQLGAEAAGKEKLRIIILFGKWKLSNQLELSFEIEYRDGRKRRISFGAEFALSQDLTVSAQLVNQKNGPLGIELILTRDFLDGHAEAFARLKKILAESSIEAGVAIPW